jgi:vanillate O-demethylase ferredoxin subunit
MTLPTTSPLSIQTRDASGAGILVRVHSIKDEALGIKSYDLRPIEARELPRFSAGAHIEVALPNGLVRHYSLVNSTSESHRYVVAVNLDPASRGGSKFMHRGLANGDTLRISEPRNHFPLDVSAESTVLFAGGIGVTPLVSMAECLTSLGRRWEMHYFSRSADRAAYVDVLLALARRGSGTLHCHFDDIAETRVDFSACVGTSASNAHLYCCGPGSMLDAFVEACADRRSSHVHLERFSGAVESASEGGYTVVLSRSGKTIQVEQGQTILDAVLANGVDVAFSCKEGVCGSCETRVISGNPDHRDSVLGPDERKANRSMMICCSGCGGTELVLDL